MLSKPVFRESAAGTEANGASWLTAHLHRREAVSFSLFSDSAHCSLSLFAFVFIQAEEGHVSIT